MKKAIVFVSFLMIGMNVWAQDTTKVMSAGSVSQNEEPILLSKKGHPILPVAGDWSVSGGTGNLFGYLGNLFNTAGNNYNPGNIFSGTNISVGYFKTNTLVYNLNVNVNSQVQSKSNFVRDDINTTANDFPMVKDTKKSANNNISVGFGLEKRFGGQRRLQRFIEGGIGLGWSNSSDKITYGNEFSTTNLLPSSTNNNANFSGQGNPAIRTLQHNDGNTVSANIYINAGAEYFFAPKMSLGLAFGAGPRFSQTFGGYTTTQRFVNPTVVETKSKVGNTTSLTFMTYTSNIYFRLFF
ncbi:hypothetical protein [uncultured Cytophaga sp.]|uniref:hypothetical protein n=1 Tax=uncultured Cytophaga sp. TaxID=160238 RepID=UPI0026114741|nr:hypothetical protein [uncultured Cytophaga sp.]